VVSAQAANSERSQAGLIFEAMINAAPFLRLAKKLPRFSRCAVAPWREDKEQHSHAKFAKPQRKADRLNGREGLHGKTSGLLYPQKAFRARTI
jgi:hypothetical protein